MIRGFIYTVLLIYSTISYSQNYIVSIEGKYPSYTHYQFNSNNNILELKRDCIVESTSYTCINQYEIVDENISLVNTIDFSSYDPLSADQIGIVSFIRSNNGKYHLINIGDLRNPSGIDSAVTNKIYVGKLENNLNSFYDIDLSQIKSNIDKIDEVSLDISNDGQYVFLQYHQKPPDDFNTGITSMANIFLYEYDLVEKNYMLCDSLQYYKGWYNVNTSLSRGGNFIPNSNDFFITNFKSPAGFDHLNHSIFTATEDCEIVNQSINFDNSIQTKEIPWIPLFIENDQIALTNKKNEAFFLEIYDIIDNQWQHNSSNYLIDSGISNIEDLRQSSTGEIIALKYNNESCLGGKSSILILEYNENTYQEIFTIDNSEQGRCVTNEIIDVSPNGNYLLTNELAFDSSSSQSIYNEVRLYDLRSLRTTTSTTDPSENQPQLDIFPNPVDEILYLSIDQLPESILLLDITGKIILSSSNVREIDVSTVPNGLYVIKILSTNGQYSTEKIVVQH